MRIEQYGTPAGSQKVLAKLKKVKVQCEGRGSASKHRISCLVEEWFTYFLHVTLITVMLFRETVCVCVNTAECHRHQVHP